MQKSTTKDTIRLYWQHARVYPKHLFVGIFFVPLANLFGTFIPPLIAANVIQRLAAGDYAPGDWFGSFGTPISLFALALLLSQIAWRCSDYFLWRLERLVQRDIAHTIYDHLLNMSANFHANSFTGSLVSNASKFIGSYMRIFDTIVYAVLSMVTSLLFTAIILWNRAPMYVIALSLTSVLYIAVAIVITKPTRDSSAALAEAESTQHGVLADSVTNVMAIKSYSGITHEGRRFRKFTDDTFVKHSIMGKYTMRQLNVFGGASRLLHILALALAVYAIVNKNASLATVFLILNYTTSIADQLHNFGQNSLRNFNRSFGDASVMTGILLQQPEVQDVASPESVRISNGQISLKDVTFTHDGSNGALFNNFNLNIKAGERVGIVGHSGSGKTTLTRLLLRFSDIDNGEILIDGQDISKITQDDLHDQITYVPQEPLLFHRSLAENIAYGNRKATTAEIKAVSKLAHSHEFIKDLPKGYDTLVGERGVKLSGGQRQRVAIARAMIKDAPVVLLDEATSALDSESEVLIQKALWKLMEGKTAIVIAHRLSTIQKMDRIIVLDNGIIAEEGSHNELLKKKGKYSELWAHQSGGFIED